MANPAGILLKILEPSKKVEATLNGIKIFAETGETVLSLLVRNGFTHIRQDTDTGQGHAYYCAMGVCFECLVTIDGVPNLRACITPLKHGMDIRTQNEPITGNGLAE